MCCLKQILSEHLGIALTMHGDFAVDCSQECTVALVPCQAVHVLHILMPSLHIQNKAESMASLCKDTHSGACHAAPGHQGITDSHTLFAKRPPCGLQLQVCYQP
jgi:hypothetical protein